MKQSIPYFTLAAFMGHRLCEQTLVCTGGHLRFLSFDVQRSTGSSEAPGTALHSEAPVAVGQPS